MATSTNTSASPASSGNPDFEYGSTSIQPPKPSRHKSVHLKPALSPLQIPKDASSNTPRKPNLPPRDKGWAAYTVLMAGTIVSSFPCGIYLSYGVFQAYYKTSTHYPSSNNAAWIGVLSSGIPFLGAPLIVYICTHTSWSRIHYVWAGWLLSIVALIGAAYSPTISSLIATQGLLYGVGVLLFDNPILLILNTWFLSHRGLAYGVVFGFADLCGVAWSFLAEYLLNHLGPRKTFLIFAVIMFAVPGPCILLLKERGATNILCRSTLSTSACACACASACHSAATPSQMQQQQQQQQQQHSSRRSSGREPCDDVLLSPIAGDFDLVRRDTPPAMKRRFWQRPVFYVFTAANLFQSLAFYLPLIYLPTYAAHLRILSPTTATAPNSDATIHPTTSTTTLNTTSTAVSTGALALALLNLSQILGELLFGRLSDLLSVHVLAVFSTTVAALSTFLLWGFCGDVSSSSSSRVLLLVYAMVYGFAGSGFLALWARMGMVFGERDAMMVFGTLAAGRGVGAIVSGPVSEVLLGIGGEGRGAGAGGVGVGVGVGVDGPSGWANAAHGQYKSLIVFVGVAMALAAVLGVVGFVVDRPDRVEEEDGEKTEKTMEKTRKSGGLMKGMSSLRRPHGTESGEAGKQIVTVQQQQQQQHHQHQQTPRNDHHQKEQLPRVEDVRDHLDGVLRYIIGAGGGGGGGDANRSRRGLESERGPGQSNPAEAPENQ